MSSAKEQMQAVIAAQAAEWFVAHRAGELSGSQREAFIEWLRASPGHVREYLALTGFAEDLAQVAKGITTAGDQLVARAQANVNVVSLGEILPSESTAIDQPRRRVLSRPRTWAAVGATAAVMATILLFGMWWPGDRSEFSTTHAEQRSWRLPDGSTVHLNSDSQIKLHFDSERRRVDLIQGQAIFQVAKDPDRPFWVHAGDAAVKAIGTEFDVYRRPQGTLISVMEGRVAVWRHPSLYLSASGDEGMEQEATLPRSANAEASRAKPDIELTAGQQAHIKRDTAVVSMKADEIRKTVAWLQRQVIFDHDSLGTAIEEFNRYSDSRIRIDDPEIRAAEINGIFSAYDSESFIRFLKHQPGMRVERIGREIVVTATEVPQ